MFKKSRVFILHFTQACVLLSVCSFHFTLSLHFTPGPQSAVCSPQSAFYSDRIYYTVCSVSTTTMHLVGAGCRTLNCRPAQVLLGSCL